MTALLDRFERETDARRLDLRATADGEPLHRSLGFAPSPDAPAPLPAPPPLIAAARHHGARGSVVGSVVGTDVRRPGRTNLSVIPIIPIFKEPIMFPTTIHTDFALQSQYDRMANVRFSRMGRYERRERRAALLAAVTHLFRHTAPSTPALDAERPATV